MLTYLIILIDVTNKISCDDSILNTIQVLPTLKFWKEKKNNLQLQNISEKKIYV